MEKLVEKAKVKEEKATEQIIYFSTSDSHLYGAQCDPLALVSYVFKGILIV